MKSPDEFPTEDQSQPDADPWHFGDIPQEEAEARVQAFFAQFNTPNVTPKELAAMKETLDSLLATYPAPHYSPTGGQAARFQDSKFAYLVERFENTPGHCPGSYGLVVCPHLLALEEGDSCGAREAITIPRSHVRQAYLSPLPGGGARKGLDFDEIFQRIQAGRISHQDGDKTPDSWKFEEYSEHGHYKTTPLPFGSLGSDTDSQ